MTQLQAQIMWQNAVVVPSSQDMNFWQLTPLGAFALGQGVHPPSMQTTALQYRDVAAFLHEWADALSPVT